MLGSALFHLVATRGSFRVDSQMDTKARMERGDMDSISTISGKDFTPLTRTPSYISESPPAYRKGRTSAVQIAKIVSWTVVAVSLVLGGSIVLAAWIQTTASCTSTQSTNEKPELLDLPRSQNLVGRSISEDPPSENTADAIVETIVVDQDDPLDILGRLAGGDQPTVNRMPLEFLFDDLFGDVIENNNHRANMNCFVEKKKTDEMEEQAAKNIALPFGLNLTTDPKFVRTTGEKMMVICASGLEHSNTRGFPMPMGQFPGPIPTEFMGPMGGPVPRGPIPIELLQGHGPIPIEILQSHGPIPIEMLQSHGPIPIEMLQSHGPIPIEILKSHGPIPIEMLQGRGPFPIEMLQGPVPMGPFVGQIPLSPAHGPRPAPHPHHMGPMSPVPLPVRAPQPPMPLKAERRAHSRALNILQELPMEMKPPMENQGPVPHPRARALGSEPVLHLIPPHPAQPEARPMRPEARSMPLAAQFVPPQPTRTARMDFEGRTPNEAHFIQPRSVDGKKRQKRCTCDCAC